MADDDTDQIDTGTGSADQDTDAGQDTWTPPSKEDYEKLQKALAKANAEAKQRREALQAMQRQSEGDSEKAVREAQEAAERKLKPVAVRAAAKAALLEAGYQNPTSERLTRAIRQLDLDALEIDDEGEVSGLADQVKAYKDDYPELFGSQEQRQRTPRVAASDRPATNGKTETLGELVAAQVFGR